MAPGCHASALLLYTVVSTAAATSRRSAASENSDSSSSAMLRREEEAVEEPPPPPLWHPSEEEAAEEGPFEREEEEHEAKANIAKAFEYIDQKIGDRLEAGKTTDYSQRDLLSHRTQIPTSSLEVNKDPAPPATIGGHQKKGKRNVVPAWFNNGHVKKRNDLAFEYQSAVGRDGYEPDPLRPASEFFGPFRVDYKHHTLYLENWNLAMNTRLDRGGMGNLVVGLNHSYARARNSVILGDSNVMQGSYGVVAGRYNKVTGRGGVVSGGERNLASGSFASVAGGSDNNATAMFATVTGGERNRASGTFSVVSGGEHNVADASESTVTAGFFNINEGNVSSINGGVNNTINRENVSATIQGGRAQGVEAVTGPPELMISTAEDTNNPGGLLTACGSAECEEEEVET